MFGYMISFETWEKFIRLSDGSDSMKDRVISLIVENLGRTEQIDSFKLGLLLGAFSNSLTKDEREDWLKTIALTRDTDNVPIISHA